MLAFIDNLRKSAMKGLTKNIGKANSIKKKKTDKAVVIDRILISRPNHRLGNQLLLLPLMSVLETQFPNAKVDLFVKGNLAPVLFQNFRNVRTYIKLPKKHFKQLHIYIYRWFQVISRKYDLVINVDVNSSSGRLSAKLSRARFKLFGDEYGETIQNYPDQRHLAKHVVYVLEHALLDLGIKTGKLEEIPSLNIKLSDDEMTLGKKLVSKYNPEGKPVISIFTNATKDKKYSKEWWFSMYGKLQESFPDHQIVEVLPVENTSQIDFSAPAYYSKDIREIAAFIANTEIFLGADSGMMHLAVSSTTPTLGLFSVTKMDIYQPYGGLHKGIDTNKLSQVEIIESIKNVLVNEQHTLINSK